MNLKKFSAALLVAAALSSGAMAKNHPYGMDIAAGVIGIEFCEAKFKESGVDSTYMHNVLDIVPVKVDTYVFPWLNNHLGIYASIGFLPGVDLNYKTKKKSGTVERAGVGFSFGVEFMAGPAFGVDLGESSVRFQVGAPIHIMFGGGKMAFGSNEWDTFKQWNDAADTKVSFSAFGFGLTPQFRFMANRRCSLVVGTDFTFDFSYNQTLEKNGVKSSPTAGADSKFRFGFVPYIGLGINFGD